MNQNHTSLGKEILPKCLFAIAVLLFVVVCISPAVAADDSLSITQLNDYYYIGEDIPLSGTWTKDTPLYFYIVGINIPLQSIGSPVSPVSGSWTGVILGSQIIEKRFDPGPYTLYVSNTSSANSVSDLDIYTTDFLQLNYPTMSITSSSYVYFVEDGITVKGTATFTDKVRYYIFGTNLFKQGEVSVTNNEFTIIDTIDVSGLYYIVVQHPMSNKLFNIQIDEQDPCPVYLYDNNGNKGALLFNVRDRQMANAAVALCDEFEYQNIDDWYRKLAFIVARKESPSPTINIDPLPSEINKGDILTISGDTDLENNKQVIVEMLDVQYIGVPKETVLYPSFYSMTTKTNADGAWSLTTDTANLNSGTYFITVSVESLGSYSVPIRIIGSSDLPNKPTETPNSDSYKDVIITPSTAITTEKIVSGSFTIDIPSGSLEETDYLTFSSPLEDGEWDINVYGGGIYSKELYSVISWVSSPQSSFKPPLFGIYHPNQDITLEVSFKGTVPTYLADYSINVFKVTCTNSKIGSYTSPAQNVYNPSHLNTDLTRINTDISNTEKRITEYTALEIDTALASQYLASAKTKADQAQTAADTTEAYARIEEAENYITNSEIALAGVGLTAANENIEMIDSASETLYERGWKSEGQELEIKVTSFRYTYDKFNEEFNNGGNPDINELDKFVFETFTIKETAESYIGGNTAPLPTTITLRTGWNVISTPKYLDTSCDTAGELLQGINSGGVSPMGYDAKTKKWYTLDKTTPIKPLDCYWIYTTEPMTLTLKYLTTPNSPSVKEVYVGWNAVGLSAENTLTAEEAFNNIAWVEYLAWDIASGKWNTVIIKGISDDKFVKPVDGGWLYVEENGIYRGKTA